jgi:hypothetical protein
VALAQKMAGSARKSPPTEVPKRLLTTGEGGHGAAKGEPGETLSLTSAQLSSLPD